MKMIPRLMIAGVLTAIAAVALLGGTAIVGAQERGDAPQSDRVERDRPPTDRPFLQHRLGHHLFGKLVEASGLERDAIVAGDEEGLTLAEVFERNGVAAESVKAEVLAELERKLEEKVESGQISEEEKARVLEQASEAIDRLLSTPLNELVHDHPGDRLRHGKLLRISAGAIGISVGELVEGLNDGMTIAEIARASGVDPADVVAALIEPLANRLSEAVENGAISEERATELLAKAEERMTTFVYEWTKGGIEEDAA